MNVSHAHELGSARHLIAVSAYVLALTVLLTMTWSAISNIGELRSAVDAAEGMLAELKKRAGPAHYETGTTLGVGRGGSPFIEGVSTNVAGAALLQRVGGAIRTVGGSILSSQVELQGADHEDGWIALLINCEIEEAALQQLLHDIEAGMPFLFVNQLVVQPSSAAGGRMRVSLSVSGRWLRAR